METWMLVPAAILVLGVAVILYGALADRARRRAALHAAGQPPLVRIPGLRADAPAPSYISVTAARTSPAGAPDTDLTDSQRAALLARLDGTVALDHGWAAPGFVTDAPGGLAVLTDPEVLVTDEIGSIREVLTPLEGALRTDRALVIVAGRVAEDVLDTLEVNVIARRVRAVVIVVPEASVRATVASGIGANEVPRGDLQAGYLPAAALGRCGVWVSSRRQSWSLAGPEAGATERPGNTRGQTPSHP